VSRVLGFAIVCVLLAITQVLAVALGVTLLLVVLHTAVRHPHETFGFLAALGLLALVSAQPTLCLGALTVMAVVGAIVGQWRKRSALSVTPPPEP